MAQSIRVSSISKSFGKKKALNKLDFSSRTGINLILGPNGAGKSTLLRCIDGLYGVDSGSVMVLGEDPYKASDIKQHMSLLTDNYALYDFLTVSRNLRFFGRLYGLKDDETLKIAKEVLQDLDAYEYLNNRIFELSRGTKQKIAFCRAILNDPEVLLLDEPTAFLDAHSAEMMRKTLLRYEKEGKTILFVTQKLDEVTRFHGRISIIRAGRIIKEMSTEGLYNIVLKRTKVNIRLAKPISARIARRIDGLMEVNSENATVLQFRVDNYRDINRIIKSLMASNASIVGVDYLEHLIDDLSSGY